MRDYGNAVTQNVCFIHMMSGKDDSTACRKTQGTALNIMFRIAINIGSVTTNVNPISFHLLSMIIKFIALVCSPKNYTLPF